MKRKPPLSYESRGLTFAFSDDAQGRFCAPNLFLVVRELFNFL